MRLRRSGLRSVASFSNKPANTEKGALPLFWGGAGYPVLSAGLGLGEPGRDDGAGVGCILSSWSGLGANDRDCVVDVGSANDFAST